ncbi:MAG TPA: hypothetical protein VFZ35_07115 [Sphingomicrobium sp.]
MWGYAFVYRPLVEGKWLGIAVIVASGLIGIAIGKTVRRRVENIDYSRH